MRTIDDRLTQATSETQSHIAQMQLENRAGVERRVRAGRMLAGATAAVLVFGVFGVTALVVSNNSDRGVAPGAGGVAPPTTLGPESSDTSTDAIIASTEPTDVTGSIPHLGITLDGWGTVSAIDGGTASSVFYDTEFDNTAEINYASAAIDISSDDPGAEPGSSYQRGLMLLNEAGEELGEVTVLDGAVATVFKLSGEDGFAFIWQASDSISVQVFAYVDSLAEATEIAQSIGYLDDSAWNEIMAEARLRESSSTTTTIAPTEPQG
ncbi:MAG: hypothetical protein M5U23_12405 [Acidimicrobiia bacterium]|nr:hypothetical protein [Acidimicrobiia bacterium]